MSVCSERGRGRGGGECLEKGRVSFSGAWVHGLW